ncbi:T9SS type A sorting domain-containing protein [Balneolaceae bacterium ANBcel3]|nr:T9SS type A sorting domain-containing protein [Balneolaceae bacterium ANBcel3]
MNWKTALIFTTCLFIYLIPTDARSFEDYIEETRGDTVVVNDYHDMGQVPNSLWDAIELDEDVPEGRVYELKYGGEYWFTRQLRTPQDRPLVITGNDQSRLVQHDGGLTPPIIAHTDVEGGPGLYGINFRNHVTLKNLMVTVGSDANFQGWSFLDAGAPHTTVTLENVLFEHTHWVFIQSNEYEGTKIHISDSYFVNMSGNPCRRNGGVYDNVGNNTGELIVENSTHIMGQGVLYKFRGNRFNKAFFNHNTFVNISGQLFAGFGYHTHLTITNNLFINSNVQGYYPGLDGPEDFPNNELDQDNLPHGIINVNHLPDNDSDFEEFEDQDRMILVYNNGIFWDDRLDGIVDWLNNHEAQGRSDWMSQMIYMNSRTEEIFADNDRYPLMQHGNWIDAGDPDFADPKDLMGDQLDEIITWSQQAGAESTDYTLPKWRQSGNETSLGGDDNNFVTSDWPVPVNLAYSNSAYRTAGLGHLPLGDLNWFPEMKTVFDANKENLHASLETALLTGEPPGHPALVTSADHTNHTNSPARFKLAQNFPNPFNPNTIIRYQISERADVRIEVFDALGRNVAVLKSGVHSPGSYQVNFDASHLSSGIYIYRLRAGDFTETRQMILVK